MLISIVIPCYNEEENVLPLSKKLLEQLNSYQIELIFIDDGSNDGSLKILKSIAASDNRVHYISLSRNFGHQNALKAGIDSATGDCIISMDADMQHPPELLPQMIEKWKEGYQIVYTQRDDDKDLSLIKRKSSHGFYSLMNLVSDIDIEQGTADFRLIDRKVADVLKHFDENHLFIRGLVNWVGYKKYKIKYTPLKRYSGVTKYSFLKMLKFAINGITSFSTKPLAISTFLGVLISGGAFLYIVYAVGLFLFTDKAVSGWASILVSVLFIGGVQLIILGIIGMYIGKIFIQSKHRPNYLINESSLSEITNRIGQ